MKAHYYEIDGKRLTLREICNEYNVSRMTFLRHIDKGMSVEEAVKKNTIYKDYKGICKRREVNYPADLVVDIIENCGINILKEKGAFDLNDIIDHFEDRLKYLYENAGKVFTDNEKTMIDKYYREGYTIVEISKEYELSKQRVSAILKSYLKRFKKRAILKYVVEDVKNLERIKV